MTGRNPICACRGVPCGQPYHFWLGPADDPGRDEALARAKQRYALKCLAEMAAAFLSKEETPNRRHVERNQRDVERNRRDVERNLRAKEMRKMRADGATLAVIAERFGVSRTRVDQILKSQAGLW